MTLNGCTTLYYTNDACFRAHHANLKEGRPTLSAQKYSPGTTFEEYKGHADIFVGYCGEGPSNDTGVVKTGNFLVISVVISSAPL